MVKDRYTWYIIVLVFFYLSASLHANRDKREYHDRANRRGRHARRRVDYYEDYYDDYDDYYDDYYDYDDFYDDDDDYEYYHNERHGRPRRRNDGRRRKETQIDEKNNDFDNPQRNPPQEKRKRKRKSKRLRKGDGNDNLSHDKDNKKLKKKDVKKWLQTLKLDEYIQPFHTAGFDDLILLSILNEEERDDLYEMVGIVKLGHKLKLRRALDALSNIVDISELY